MGERAHPAKVARSAGATARLRPRQRAHKETVALTREAPGWHHGCDMRPLLVLFTGTTVPNVRASFGDFDAHFRARAGDAWSHGWSTHDARDEASPLPDPGAHAGVIVTGSSSSVTERAPWMLRLEGWLREAVWTDAPLLGVCFGHQLLASALGGEVRQNAAGRRLGSLEVSRTDDEDPLLDGLGARFAVNVSHRDHVAIAPEGVRRLVTADHDPMHAFAVGKRVRAVQFHPEFDQPILRGYIEARREILRAEGMDPEVLHARAADAPAGERVLRNFLTHFVTRDVNR